MSLYSNSVVYRSTLAFSLLFLLTGCATYGVIDNRPIPASEPTASYSIKAVSQQHHVGEISLVLAFSGGGTRAAALAYGVLEALRDTTIIVDGQPRRMLDEVDVISSVSGGSFTSAYYGLNGDRTFDDFEQVFLRQDIDKQLIHGLFNPLRWFSSSGRTEMAVAAYEKSVFRGATFADLQQRSGPLILINASDLNYGSRFSFIQENFNLLCSDISTFPVARAVTASSSVPILFNPVVVENFKGCTHVNQEILQAAAKKSVSSPQMRQVVQGLESYYDKDNRRYIHLVDGGVTDNLGLRAIYEVIEVAGGARAFLKMVGRKPVRRFAVISVNASTEANFRMDASNKQPSLEDTINAVTKAQLHRYNAATLELLKESINRWAEEVSTADNHITPYFVQVNFSNISNPEKRDFINSIPTRFSLTNEQVDALIAAGHELLRNNPDYQRFIADVGGTSAPPPETAPATTGNREQVSDKMCYKSLSDC